MDVVYAAGNTTLAHAGLRFRINAGEAWDASDPLVASYPDMFTDQPRAVRTTQTREGWMQLEQPVEQATRAPGEKSSAMRPDKRRALERAERLGVEVDGRWSVAKIDLACDEAEAQNAVAEKQGE